MRSATAVAGSCLTKSQTSGSNSTMVTATARRKSTRRGSDVNRADHHPGCARHHHSDDRQRSVVREVKVAVALRGGERSRAQRDQQGIDGERTCQGQDQCYEHAHRFRRLPRGGTHGSLRHRDRRRTGATWQVVPAPFGLARRVDGVALQRALSYPCPPADQPASAQRGSPRMLRPRGQVSFLRPSRPGRNHGTIVPAPLSAFTSPPSRDARECSGISRCDPAERRGRLTGLGGHPPALRSSLTQEPVIRSDQFGGLRRAPRILRVRERLRLVVQDLVGHLPDVGQPVGPREQ